MGIIANIAGLACFVLCILMAIKMFQAQQIWQGILTIICTIFGVVYGFMKKDELGLQKLALPALITFIIAVVANVLAVMGGAGAGV